MKEQKVQIPTGFTEALQDAATLEFHKYQKHFGSKRDDFGKEIQHWDIDRKSSTPEPLKSLKETLLQAFDVVIHLALLKANILEKLAVPKMESADGSVKLPWSIIDLVEDSHLTPVIAAIKADPQFSSYFQNRGEEQKNEIAKSFLGSVINKALIAIRESPLQKTAGVYDFFGDFGDERNPLKIRLADVEGTPLNLQNLREKILARRSPEGKKPLAEL
jgi:hypothetical protein